MPDNGLLLPHSTGEYLIHYYIVNKFHFLLFVNFFHIKIS